MKSLKLFVVLALSLLILPAVYGQKTINRIDKKGEIRIAMTGEQPPYSTKDKYGTWMGFEVELAEALAKSMGVKLTLVELPFDQLLTALEDKKVDAVMSGLTITPERNSRFYFAGPYSVSGKSIITKSEVLSKIANSDDMNEAKYKIACLKGSTSEKFIQEAMNNVQIVTVENYDKGVELVLNDGADAMVADFPACVVTAMRYADQGIITLDQPLTIEPIGVALPADDPQLLNLVENYIGALQLSGALDMLHEKWFVNGGWILDMD